MFMQSGWGSVQTGPLATFLIQLSQDLLWLSKVSDGNLVKVSNIFLGGQHSVTSNAVDKGSNLS